MPSSTEFNEACYLARYPDVKANWKGPAIEHYMTGGGKQQGRVPGCDLPGTVYSPDFDESAYLARYPDVKLLWKGTASDHYFKAGGREQGRVPGFEIITGDLPPNSMVTPGTVIFKKAETIIKDPDPKAPADTKDPAVNAVASPLTKDAVDKKATQSKLIVIGLCSLLFIGLVVVVVKRKQIFG